LIKTSLFALQRPTDRSRIMAEALRVASFNRFPNTGISFDSQKASERDGYTKRFLEILSDQDVSERMVTVHTEDGLQDTIDTDYEAAEA